MTLDIGSCFHREQDSASVMDQARAVEDAGYDEFWVIEDCFYTAGPTLAAASLAATESIAVGIGIMPTVARNPAVTAMEIATLGCLAPGRFHAGIGHGVQSWMAQMHEQRNSPLTMLSETLTAVRRLLAGERVTIDGTYVSLDDVELDATPDPVPLVSAGVRGPKSLRIAGQCADGTIMADFVSPTYLRWANQQIAAEADHRITVFATMAIDADGAAMRQAMTPVLAQVCAEEHISLTMAPFYEELAEKAAKSSWETAVGAMPAEWWNQIAAVGTPDDAAQYLAGLEAAGAHAVAFFPNPAEPIADLRRSIEYLRPGGR
ncbi:MAG: LLM class flavin-dependent oxidoreductase [Acidimicrobiales bacterium]